MIASLPLGVSFLYPAFLWLALLLPLLWWRMGRVTSVTQRLLRSGAMGCVVLALAQPSLIQRRPGVEQVIVFDARSGATGIAALERVVGRLATADRITLITLGNAKVPTGPRPINRNVTLAPGALSSALDRALVEIAPGTAGVVTVIGDGHARDAHWDRAVDGLIRRGIPVNSIATRIPAGPPAIADISFAPVRMGELARADIYLEGRGEGVQVELSADGATIARSVPIAIDGPTQVTLEFPAPRIGFMPVRVSLVGTTDGARDALLAVQDPLRLLYLEGGQRNAAAPLQTLLGPGFAVDSRSPDTLNGGLDLSSYPLILIDDVPARALPAPMQRRLLDQVAQGGTGLFYSGGAQAFGMGGYDGTPLADALPVTLRQENKVEQPSVALVVIIDSSGSMAGTPLELAKQVARFAVRKLRPSDSVGIVEFYGAKQWAVPLQPALDVPGVERAIGRMQAQGSSVLFPAIQEAYYALKGSNARYRHILVISDAGVEEQRYQTLLTHIAEDRVNVSTALVGNDAEGEDRMVQWARWGGGRYYGVPDEFGLVELDLKQPQDKPAPGYRSGSFALRPWVGHSRWHGMALAGVPPLRGYVPAGHRAKAETLLTTTSGDPILASWQHGAGRITALMSEPLGQGTQSWRNWRDYGRWFGQLLARTADQNPAATLTLSRRFDWLHAMLRDPASNGAVPTFRLVGKDGNPGRSLAMEERAPGLFQIEIPLDPNQPARAEAWRGTMRVRAADPARSDVGDGHRLPLDTLAQLTKGVHGDGSTDAALSPRRPKGSALAAVALAGWLALLALLFYLAELVLRRWPGRGRAA